jgi:hypothetical protein
MAIKFQTRRGTSSNWSNSNPTLAVGEIGFETDTYKLKIGNGSNTWTNLAYIAGPAFSNLGTMSIQNSDSVSISGGNLTNMTLLRSLGIEINETHQHRLYSENANNIITRIGNAGPYYTVGTTDGSDMKINSSSGGDIKFSTGVSPSEITHLAIDRINDRVDFKNSKIFASRFTQPGDGTNLLGELISQNADQPAKAGVGTMKMVYIRNAVMNIAAYPSSQFDSVTETVGRWDDIRDGFALTRFDITMTPLPYGSGLLNAPGDEQKLAMTCFEFNPTNRTGCYNPHQHEQRLVRNSINGLRAVPETQDFTSTLGNTRVGMHCFSALSLAPSSFVKNFDSRPVEFDAGNIVKFTKNPGVITGMAVKFSASSGNSLPSSIISGNTYYTIRVSDTTCRIANTAADAAANVFKTLSGYSGSNHVMQATEFHSAKFTVGYVSDPNSFAPRGYSTFSYGFRPFVVSANVVSGGSGYAVGNILNISSGTNYSEDKVAKVKVTSVSSGAITGVELYESGGYLNIPASPTTPTNESGNGANASISFVMAHEATQRPHAAHGIAGIWNYGIDCTTPITDNSSATFRYASFSNHAIRLPNGSTNGIAARSAAGNADISLLYTNSSDQAVLFDQKIIKRTTWNPTFTTSNTDPSVTNVIARYSQFSGIVEFYLSFQVTTHGNGGDVKFTLPINARENQAELFSGIDLSSVQGNTLICIKSSDTANVVRCTTSVLVNGNFYLVKGTYEAESA